jgi:hypothetical protein
MPTPSGTTGPNPSIFGSVEYSLANALIVENEDDGTSQGGLLHFSPSWTTRISIWRSTPWACPAVAWVCAASCNRSILAFPSPSPLPDRSPIGLRNAWCQDSKYYTFW